MSATKYDGKARVYKSLEEVKGVYTMLQSDRPVNTWEEKVPLFKDPTVEGWELENIGTARLVGCGPERKETREVKLHKAIVPLVEQIFREILAANREYRILSLSDYMFRYVKGSLDKYPHWIGGPEYKGITQSSPHISYALEDRRLGRFAQPIPGTTVKRRDKLSNHAFGTALDINARTNEYSNAGLCDIDPFIVDLFQRRGFYWGGFYNSTRDYMHFEYVLDQLPSVGEMPRVFHFPVALGDGRNAAVYYANNESSSVAEGKGAIPTTEGGFFPLALPNGGRCGLHGGIHLASSGDGEIVRAMAQGEVVAARLAPPDHEETNATVTQALRNWNNFVLVRHTFDAGSLKGKHLYSLYMHLAPVRFPQADDEFGTKAAPVGGDLGRVPWLRRLFLGRHGLLVKTRPGGPGDTADIPVGTPFWCAREIELREGVPTEFQTDVLSVDGTSARRVALRSEPDDQGASICWWEHKAAPQDVAAVWRDLQQGKVVSFARRSFPVASGEAVGITACAPDAGSVVQDGGSPSFRVSPRYLHWEVFAPAADGTIPGLLEALRGLGAPADLAFPVLDLRDPGATLTGSDIKTQLAGASAPAKLSTLPEEPSASEVVGLFDDQVRRPFQQHVKIDLSDLVPPTRRTKPGTEHVFRLSWIGGREGAKAICGPRIALRITDSQASAEWLATVPFTIPSAPPIAAPIPLNAPHWSGTALVDLLLSMPGGADTLRVERFDPNVLVAPPEGRSPAIDWSYFRTTTGVSWRNLRLVHASDWLPAANQEQLSDGVGANTPPGALAWWDPACEAPAFGGESIFGTMLPSDGVVDCLHPVTLKWVLELVRNFGKEGNALFAAPSSAAGNAAGGTDPIAVGFLVSASDVAYGSPVVVASADREYFLGAQPENAPSKALILERIPAGAPPLSHSSGGAARIPTDSAGSFRSRAEAVGRDALSGLADSARGALEDALDSDADDPQVATLEISPVVRIPLNFSEVGVQVGEWTASVWGRLRARAEQDDDRANTEAWGREEIEVARPRFGGEPAAWPPHADEHEGRWTWDVPWKGPAPAVPLRALVELVFLKDGKRHPSGLAVVGDSTLARDPDPLTADPSALTMDGAYILPPPSQNGRPAPEIQLMPGVGSRLVFAGNPPPTKVHRRLVRALGTMKARLDHLVVRSMDRDGNGATLDGGQKSATAYEASGLFETVDWNVPKRTGKVRIDPDETPRLTFSFDARMLVAKVYGEDRPDMVGADYAFDLHLVQGFSGSTNHSESRRFYRLPKTRDEDAFATFSFPLRCGSFPVAGFGAAQASLQALLPAPGATAGAAGLAWVFRVELVGDPVLWARLAVEMNVARGGGSTGWRVANLVDGAAVLQVPLPDAAATDGYLRTGEHTISLRLKETPPPKAKGAAGKAKAAVASPLDSVGGSLGLARETTTRRVDLTPRLAQPVVSEESGVPTIEIPSTGLATSHWMDESCTWGIPAGLSGACRVEIRDGSGDPLRGADSSKGNVIFPDPDGTIRLDIPPSLLTSPDGRHTVVVSPVAESVRGASMLPVSVPLQISPEARP